MIAWLGAGRPRTSEAEARRIQAEARKLPRRARAAFTAACAQRLLDAAPRESLGEASRTLADVWAFLAGDPHALSLARAQALSDRILRENDPAFDAAYDAALAATVHAARAALTGHHRFAPWTAKLALAAAEARGEAAAERARQARDLRTLQRPMAWAAALAALREP